MNAESSFDVVVSDYRMPGMDGLGFLAAVAERGLDLRVILVTGYGSIESAVEMLEHFLDMLGSVEQAWGLRG